MKHCLASSAYYRDIIADFGINPDRCEVGDFPVLDKATVIANFDRIATDPAVTWARVSGFAAEGGDDETLMDGRFHVIHTSGSSGETGYFVFSNDEWARRLAPALRINPYRGRRRRLAFYGIVNDHGAGAGMAMTSNQGLLRLAYDARGFDILRPVEETVAAIDAFGPDIIVGYPTAIHQLADAQRAGRMNIAPQFLQCSGEVVFPEHRQAIEQAFGRPLINVYSSSEHLIMGMSRGGDDGMMLFEENFVFEQNEDHTLVTNLYNYTLPLIRYRMNDRLIAAEKPATDRHPYRRIKEIVGRAEGGDLVFKTARRPRGAHHLLRLRLADVEGASSASSSMSATTGAGSTSCRSPASTPRASPGPSAMPREKLRDLFASRSLHHVEISVCAVAAIEPDPATGKVRAVVTSPRPRDPGLGHFPAEQAA